MPGVSITQPRRRAARRATRWWTCAGPGRYGVDHAGRPVGGGHEPVDQRRLADPGVPDEHGHPPGEASRTARARRRRPCVAAGHDIRHGQCGVVVEHGVGLGEVGLGEHSSGVEPGVVGGDQAAVDEPGPRRGVGQRSTTTSWSALATTTRSTGSVSSRGAPQHRPARRRRARCGRACRSRRCCRRRAPRGRRRRRRLRPSSRAPHGGTTASRVRDAAGVPAAVDRDDEPLDGVVVPGSLLAARPGLDPLGRTRTSSSSQRRCRLVTGSPGPRGGRPRTRDGCHGPRVVRTHDPPGGSAVVAAAGVAVPCPDGAAHPSRRRGDRGLRPGRRGAVRSVLDAEQWRPRPRRSTRCWPTRPALPGGQRTR